MGHSTANYYKGRENTHAQHFILPLGFPANSSFVKTIVKFQALDWEKGHIFDSNVLSNAKNSEVNMNSSSSEIFKKISGAMGHGLDIETIE